MKRDEILWNCDRHSVEPVTPSKFQICCGIWTNVKMDGRISQQVPRSWHKIYRVNSIHVAKSMIFFNILGAIAPWVTSSWAIVFFALSLHLLPLVYILWVLPAWRNIILSLGQKIKLIFFPSEWQNRASCEQTCLS